MTLEHNKIHHMDCLEGLKQLEDNSIDLVVTDPPYYKVMIKDHKGNKHDWDNQWETFDEYLEWCNLWFAELKRVLKDNGSLYVFADDKVCAYLQVALDKLFNLENSIVWVKPNSLNNKGWHEKRRYAQVTERLLFYSNLWDVSSNSKVIEKSVITTRDYIRSEILRAKGEISFKKINTVLGTATNGGGVASACLSLSKSEPVMITEEHYVKLKEWLNDGTGEYLRKEYEYLRKEYEELRKEYEELRRPFNPKANFTDVWTQNITSSSEKTYHPTQKPIKLIRRIVETSSKEGALVLDLFMGSGTTAVACAQLGRDFIGFELEEEYIKIANERVKKIKQQDRLGEWF